MNKLTEPTKKEIQIQLAELKIKLKQKEQEIFILKNHLNKLQKIIDSKPIIIEDQYLWEINRLQHFARHYQERYRAKKKKLQCDWCNKEKKKMSIWYNLETYEILMLCFGGCQFFPDPYKDTEAGMNNKWIRIDPWQNYKQTLPRLRKEGMNMISQNNFNKLQQRRLDDSP